MPQRKPKARTNAKENDPRFEAFAALYIADADANAHQCALRAGYAGDYAKSHAYQLVARLEVVMGQALKHRGLDTVYLAKRMEKLVHARTVKWNPNKIVRKGNRKQKREELRGGWDEFEDTHNQIRAVDMCLKLHDAYPALKLSGPGGSGDAIPVKIVSSIERPVRKPKQVGA